MHRLQTHSSTACVHKAAHRNGSEPPPWTRPPQIKEENPRLARDSRILRVTMDNVYEVFTTPREQTGLQVGAPGGGGAAPWHLVYIPTTQLCVMMVISCPCGCGAWAWDGLGSARVIMRADA